MKVKIRYPQIVIYIKEVEVTEEQFDNLINHHIDVDNFVWNHMTEQEQNHTQGQKWVESAIEYGYAGVFPENS